MKKVLAGVMALLLLCTMLPLGAVSVSAEITTGTTGDCTWTLDGTHLTISGNGAMGDYTYSKSAPWGREITSVTIEDDVTTIGKYAFCEYTSLTSVTIGDSVTTIRDRAFNGCTYLTSVTIPDSVTTIGAYAFGWCSRLTSVTIGDGITTIGKYAFSDCRSLTSVAIPDSITAIGENAFSYCSSLTSVTIGDSITTIDECAFYKCSSLTSVTIGDSVTTIGAHAFESCALTDVYYGGSEASKSNITIGKSNTPLLDATWHYAADPISSTVTHSVMDTENGNGLAFRFELAAKGVDVVRGNVANLTNATVNYLGEECKLLGMGAVVSNESGSFELIDVNGRTILDIPVVYLQELEPNYCVFAVRIVNIPDTALERIVYARPYYIVEVDDEEIVVYGDVDTASCAEYM